MITSSGLALLNSTTYIYDAEGRRLAKAHQIAAPEGSQGATLALDTIYVLGKDGEEISELDGQGNWLHSNVYVNGQLLATITPDDTLFSLNDWLGTKRVTVGASLCGTAYTQFPFGDGLAANPLVVNGATLTAREELNWHHFTGKERDNESGNDYFGARYYENGMGRFATPDWSQQPSSVPYATFSDPQSLNLYRYSQNAPVGKADLDGHCDWCQRLYNAVKLNGFHTNAELSQATVTVIQGGGIANPDQTTTMQVSPFGNTVFQGGVSVSDAGVTAGWGASYVPTTGDVYGSFQYGAGTPGLGAYAGLGPSDNLDQTQTQGAVSGGFVLGVSSSPLTTGGSTDMVGLMTPGASITTGPTVPIGTLPSATFGINITTMPQTALPIGDGLSAGADCVDGRCGQP